MVLGATLFQNTGLTLTDITVALGTSLLASVAVYFIYYLFYGSRTIGAGVNRSFIVGGPAITALFLGIQTSIPLSLGLLGALSFVRFRTPVKDSAEIGFLLLLIAGSIGAATGTQGIVVILFVLVFLALSVQWLIQNRFSLKRFANVMISLDKDVYSAREKELNQFLGETLDGLHVKTLSVMDDRISLHYQFRKRGHFDKTGFIRRLNALSSPGKAELFFDSAS